MYSLLTLILILAAISLSIYGINQKNLHVRTTPFQEDSKEYFDLSQSKHYKKALVSTILSGVFFLAWVIATHIIVGTSLAIGSLCFISILCSNYTVILELKSPTANVNKQLIAGSISTAFLLAAIVFLVVDIFVS